MLRAFRRRGDEICKAQVRMILGLDKLCRHRASFGLWTAARCHSLPLTDRPVNGTGTGRLQPVYNQRTCPNQLQTISIDCLLSSRVSHSSPTQLSYFHRYQPLSHTSHIRSSCPTSPAHLLVRASTLIQHRGRSTHRVCSLQLR